MRTQRQHVGLRAFLELQRHAARVCGDHVSGWAEHPTSQHTSRTAPENLVIRRVRIHFFDHTLQPRQNAFRFAAYSRDEECDAVRLMSRHPYQVHLGRRLIDRAEAIQHSELIPHFLGFPLSTCRVV